MYNAGEGIWCIWCKCIFEHAVSSELDVIAKLNKVLLVFFFIIFQLQVSICSSKAPTCLRWRCETSTMSTIVGWVGVNSGRCHLISEEQAGKWRLLGENSEDWRQSSNPPPPTGGGKSKSFFLAATPQHPLLLVLHLLLLMLRLLLLVLHLPLLVLDPPRQSTNLPIVRQQCCLDPLLLSTDSPSYLWGNRSSQIEGGQVSIFLQIVKLFF